MKRIIVLGLGLVCATSAVASAQSRVAVSDFEGPNAAQVQKAVLAILEDHDVEVVPSKRVDATAKRSGAEFDTESGRVRVGKRLKLTAFIEGRTERARRDVKVHVAVYSGRDGMKAGELRLSAPRGVALRELRATFWEQLSAAVSGNVKAPEPEFEVVEPESEPEPIARRRQEPVAATPRRAAEPVVADEPDAEDEEVAQAEDVSPTEDVVDEGDEVHAASALDVHVGARFGTRSFSYSDPMPGLRDYGLKMSPNLALRVQWYPVAHFDSGVLSNIGLDMRGEMLVGVSSRNRTGQKFATSASSYGIGLRGRLPLSKLELGALVGYGAHAFSLEGTKNSEPDVPGVGYGFLRFGLDGRFKVSEAATVSLEAAYLHGLAHGEIAERAWFPHTSGGGLEAEATVGWQLSRVLGLEVAVGFQRYFLSFDPRPDDPGVRGPGRVAGGALDQYLSTRLGMVLRL